MLKKVLAGGALAVDRERFLRLLRLKLPPILLITVVREEVRDIPENGNRLLSPLVL